MRFLAYLGIFALIGVTVASIPFKVGGFVVDKSEFLEQNPVKVVTNQNNLPINVIPNLDLQGITPVVQSSCGLFQVPWQMENLLQPQNYSSMNSLCGQNLEIFHSVATYSLQNVSDISTKSFYPKLVNRGKLTIAPYSGVNLPNELPEFNRVGLVNAVSILGLLIVIIVGIFSLFYKQLIKEQIVYDSLYFTKLVMLRC